MSIVINFTTRIIQGFVLPGLADFPVKITAATDEWILFEGHEERSRNREMMFGRIDRMWGTMSATDTVTITNMGQPEPEDTTSYNLQCKPKQRVF